MILVIRHYEDGNPWDLDITGPFSSVADAKTFCEQDALLTDPGEVYKWQWGTCYLWAGGETSGYQVLDNISSPEEALSAARSDSLLDQSNL